MNPIKNRVYKPKKCRICGKEFIPKSSRSTVCNDPNCAKEKHKEIQREYIAKKRKEEGYKNRYFKPEAEKTSRFEPIMTLDEKLELARRYKLEYADIQFIAATSKNKTQIRKRAKELGNQRKSNEKL